MSGLSADVAGSDSDMPLPVVELFSAEQMEAHGVRLARSHRLNPRPGPNRLLGSLATNEESLLVAGRVLAAAVRANRRVAPAGEWLLDNFYLIEEQIRTAKRHFPKGYSRALPRLASGPSAGLPRVYDIAREAIAHGDGRVDPESLSRFILAYQKVTALDLGELWAIPIMLRLALIENLSSVGARVAASTLDKDRAAGWADWMTEVAERDPKSLILAVADMARSNPAMASSFVAELARRLQGHSAALALPLTWIEQRLAESGRTIDHMVQLESQTQAAGQVSVSNSIASLRLFSAMDWREFVESKSQVEQLLQQDPAGVYPRMDFQTRDTYRHVVEHLAKVGRLSELDVARQVLDLARQGRQVRNTTVARETTGQVAHVGHYLIGAGLRQLEQLAGVPWIRRARSPSPAAPLPVGAYLAVILLLTLALASALAAIGGVQAYGGWAQAVLLGLLVATASQPAIAVVNWFATMVVPARILPRLDFSTGIAGDCRTLVVVPAMLADAAGFDLLCETLEVHYLANRDEQLHFALLTDFTDAGSEALPIDAALTEHAAARIAELNERYPTASRDSFLLFHRPRHWNRHERCWMGRERKRGKLSDLNSVLRGADRSCFSLIVGDTARLATVKYVITLDSDTRLPRDAARQLVAAMAHPLNRPVIDPGSRRIVAGYGILQPRVMVGLASTSPSRYARLLGNDSGIDPYTRAVSDVYQDLFGEGSFIGKGIYDVDVLEQTLSGRLPDNRILSHDLLEGCYARSGLLSDAFLTESAPASYAYDVSRRRRWIRGDWQIASWMLARVPGTARDPGKGDQPSPLSLLSRWKIFDNLRRSLVPGVLVLLLLAAWTVLQTPLLWTAIVVAIVLLPQALATVQEAWQRPYDMSLGAHLLAVTRGGKVRLSGALFALSCLLHEACYGCESAALSSWRVLVSRRRLLEWKASAAPALVSATAAPPVASGLLMNCLLAIAIAATVTLANPDALPVALPLLLMWFSLPMVSHWLDRPPQASEAPLDAAQQRFLRRMARKTWSFFETFVGAEDHWLPPDNFQEYPAVALAHRTSPTNIGLALLSTLAAHDLGYLTVADLLVRLEATLATMRGLARHEGHFYNWYDTLSLQPLPPLYVSTVDSGNLAAHLMTLASGLAGLADEGMLGARWREGLRDNLDVMQSLQATASPIQRAALEQLERQFAELEAMPVSDLPRQHAALERVALCADALVATTGAADTDLADWRWWARAQSGLCRGLLDEFALLAPWVALAAPCERLREVLARATVPTLRAVEAGLPAWLGECLVLTDGTAARDEQTWIAAVQACSLAASQAAAGRIATLHRLAAVAVEMAQPRYDFLYDKARRLLVIGSNISEHRPDSSFYDMLASEARLGSFMAVAQGELPQEHWFALGRLLTSAGGDSALLSWSGSMFEYLMPMLVMPSYENSLLDHTAHAVVEEQIRYAAKHRVPWGISESGYNTVDALLNYQYRGFGVPGLGLKPGLEDDLVITPYASALALMVSPARACQNLMRLVQEGCEGRHGFYEALDFTPARLPRRQDRVLVRSFMAHHQGMILLAIDHVLSGAPMQRRFMSDPMVQATLLLLQERIPRSGGLRLQAGEFSIVKPRVSDAETPVRVIATAATAAPEVQLLSNGRYHVMLTQAGGGYSRWNDLGVTRWREDPTSDNWGAFCYLRDVDSNSFWSNTHQPTLARADCYEAIFSEGRAEYRRKDLDYDTHTEIVVSPEDDIELRRLHITNGARGRRVIEVTSYAEVVLAAPISDTLHPAFSNLFVQTEVVSQRQALLCTRRPRSSSEAVPWMIHLMAVRGAVEGSVSYETDRARFIGRGRSVVSPQALLDRGDLSGTAGSVLDPIVAIRQRVVLEPHQTVIIDLVTGMAATREAALTLASRYQDRHLADRAFDLAWTHSQVALRQINASETDAQRYARIASSVLYANAGLRADPAILLRNRRSQSGLWGYSISGDLPLVLVQIGDPANIDLVRQMVQAHAYWRLKGLAVDLVIWNEDQAGYRQQLQEQIMGLIASGVEAHVIDKPGGIFVRRSEQMPEEERMLVQSAARVIVNDRLGSLEEQLLHDRLQLPRASGPLPGRFKPSRASRAAVAAAEVELPADLQFANGIGGFSADGSEYVIRTSASRATPAAWVNVIANAEFGTVIAESGSAYTWSENAQEFRLSPWNNDPVGDTGGEAFYLRDEESGHFWSPTPLPRPGNGAYLTRHGFGYSSFEHVEDGIASELLVYVALSSNIKFSVLTVRNRSGRARQLSATGYVEWVLGDLRSKTAMHVTTETSQLDSALYARNVYNRDFPERTAFFDVDDANRTFTCDRGEFLGRNRSLRDPVALSRIRLSDTAGAGFDPCGALQSSVHLADGEEHQWCFCLGSAADSLQARAMVARWRAPGAAAQVLGEVKRHWQRTLGAVQVHTADPALDLLANGWLLYQTLACRMWGRSGFYQSGGAFGFRDQLQDAMGLMHAEPALARAHLLRCSARQFQEGDVQHWWHPTSGRGVRTRCSDDFLWLPLAVCRYVALTGDHTVLDECAPFLEGRPLGPHEDSYFDLPHAGGDVASLYQHCVRAVAHGLRFGAHGLPLMGSGDWNDGMNLVGIEGRGESVWLGFFLFDVLTRFASLAAKRGDSDFAVRCREAAQQLRGNIEQHAWDGAWYRRAYFDDGTPLGSAGNAECQLDAVSQSWSVLSGAGDPLRAAQAMRSMDERLVSRERGLIALLAPPFDRSDLEPGYIKGYVPGVRENGGQYTHAAIWGAMAFAALGDRQRAWDLFRIINPIHHGGSAAAVAVYRVEPYVVAADLYALPPHTGRGGWTWYTGSAGWLYRLITESLLGLQREHLRLSFAPCLPRQWSGFSISYRNGEASYRIHVAQREDGQAGPRVIVDGVEQQDPWIPLLDESGEHVVEWGYAAPVEGEAA